MAVFALSQLIIQKMNLDYILKKVLLSELLLWYLIMTKLIVTKRLKPMLMGGVIPREAGWFIDTYNKHIQRKCYTLLADKQDGMHGHLYVTVNSMDKLDKSKMKNVRIRKLTNRECYRFQGVPEDYIDKLLATDIARGQHYKLAGNSICVPVLTAVFKRMFVDKTEHKPQQISLI